ncbi:TIGR02710 family CRISPR-associated CARF protein [Fervidibacillus albus]|uniref:TIGR02710 family CRISPR-associated CARF protein n=1 Tax=Fervidibacillus albus TaxID=2980026 RepID=A0A9E8LUQ3_9BACI|nr:TIGR02710 family CRISPR-associated CARF protein [Fervidibacillus albus]WAA09846.1 TIGR02710 family CRISPR-associated CARF protein [Fervidibacillus albus]
MPDMNAYLAKIEEKKKVLADLDLQSAERNHYYETEVFPLIREYFQKVESNKLENRYDLLILSVGSTFEPLVLSIDAVQPKKVVFLYTKESEKNIDKIDEFINFRPTQMKMYEVDHINPEKIYQRIKEISLQNEGKKIGIDFTGGTKAMSAGMAMAGGMIGADLFYIASKWNKLTRKPEPGSERLKILKNPYELFGDIEIERAQELWSQGEYFAASVLLEEVYKKLPEQYEYRVLAALGKAYSSWEVFNIKAAYEHLHFVTNEGVSHLSRLGKPIFSEKDLHILKKQLEILKVYKEKNLGKDIPLKTVQDVHFMKNLILFFKNLAVKEEEQKRYDIASLYYYRMIEVIGQHRIARFDINTSNPDYSNLKMNQKSILEKINALLKQSKLKQEFHSLPEKLALADTHLLLYVLNDPIAKRVSPSKLRDASEARNYSILAHGFLTIDEEIFKKIRKVAMTFFYGFLQENGEDEFNETLQFITPNFFKTGNEIE